MSFLYHTLIYDPLLNVLVFFYQTIAFEDLGIAIILLTIFIRLLLYPIFAKSVRHSLALQRLQPEIKKIQEKLKHDRVQQGQAMMELYKTNRINPFSGIFLLLVQFPVLIALFQIMSGIVSPEPLAGIYKILGGAAHLSASFVGLIDLTKPSILLVALAAIAQYLQARMSIPKRDSKEALSPIEKAGRQMVYVAPFITVAVLWKLPAALGIYWSATSLFSVLQQMIISREFATKTNGSST